MLRGLFILFLFSSSMLSAQIAFDQQYTDVGRIGFAISNVGTIGRPNVRNDTQGPPSMEYPINSGIEHLFEGGLWIGALSNGQTRVSTASVDATAGYTTGSAGFEFTAMGPISERSRLTSSDKFTTNAISHQDYIVNFTDSNIVIPGTSIPIASHTDPLRAVVRLESYAWNFSFADFFVILNYEITNTSTSDWDSVYLGMWTDMVIRNVNVTQDNGSAFFNKGGGGVEQDLGAVYAFQVTGDDIDFTQSYGAMQILGADWRNLFFHPDNDSVITAAGYSPPQIRANFWDFRQFGGGDFQAPNSDQQRYFKMRNTLNFNDPGVQAILKGASNKTQLITLGPIPQIAAGETVTFTMGAVCARQLLFQQDNPASREELREHLEFCRRTYLGEDLNANGLLDAGEDLNENQSLDRYTLPEPPATPKVKIIPSNNKVDIYWDASALASIDPISKRTDFEGFRLYRSNPGDDKGLSLIDASQLVAQWDSSGNSVGFNNGFSSVALDEPVFFDGDTTPYVFHYEMTGLLNGWQYMFIVTSFDEGDSELGLDPLESSFIENAFRVWSGTEPNDFDGDDASVGVYPNPYRTEAVWDGNTSRTKKIYFYNLPNRCLITIYNSAGDVITSINHNSDTYQGDDIRWFDNFGGDRNRVFSGGEHAWDLLSATKNTISQGIYLFSVKDLQSGNIQTGKFAVLK